MTRRWNATLWIGFLIVLAAPVAYLKIFVRYPITRDVPWAPLLMFAAGLPLMGLGLARAYREPQLYRGRIAGSAAIGVSAILVAFTCYTLLYVVRQLPPSASAPKVGEEAPDFSLPDTEGRAVTLRQILGAGADEAGRTSGALLVFYRGYW